MAIDKRTEVPLVLGGDRSSQAYGGKGKKEGRLHLHGDDLEADNAGSGRCYVIRVKSGRDI